MRILAIFLLVLALCGCGSLELKKPTDIQQFDVAKDLYNLGVDKEENWCWSPYSLLDCLSMAAPGVQGTTLEEYAKLGLDRFKAYAEYDRELPDGLDISCRAYVNKARAVDIDERYIRNGSKIETLAFDSAALERINSNVSQDTHGKIPSIFESIDPNAVSYFVNAVYFNGKWDYKEKDVRWRTDVDMRHGFTGELDPLDVREANKKVDIAKIPYSSTEDVSFYLICPNEGNGGTGADVDKYMEGDFGEKDLDFPCGKAKYDEAYFEMPSFQFPAEPQVEWMLRMYGITDMFTDDADFGELGALRVSQIRQKAYVDVNNKGTEAAAATGMEIFNAMAPQEKPKKIKYVEAHDAFAFVIRDDRSGAILFMGRVCDPAGRTGERALRIRKK
ncbi:MAG: hypothetical protein NC489_39145 [Ruminococcus flavefaciens]|nr:hypothetical protein [Ruminococcus flavefaciens]